jgi:hypothetical protein
MTSMDVETPSIEIPFDVQRLIFENAARSDRKVAMKLLVLCRYVQPWYTLLTYDF